MNHTVSNVQQLHEQASALLNNIVLGEADTIISNLTSGVNTLKNTWKGKDAGVQINNVITVLNQMILVRNSLAHLAIDSSKVAASYRDIQNSNGANLETLGVLSCDDKTQVEQHVDNADTVSITPEADNGRANIDDANGAINDFASHCERSFNDIMQNWSTGGSQRANAEASFSSFKSNVTNYIELLSTASTNIRTALTNYSSFN